MRAEGGFQLDVFSESYGGGDLFAETTDVADPDPFTTELRIKTDEVLPGGYAAFRWQPDVLRRYIGVRSELNEKNASTRFEGRWETDIGRGWTLALDERLRVQQELEDQESTDLLQTFTGFVQRTVPSFGDVRFYLLQEHASVDGDSLSRLYDFDMIGGAVRVKHRWGETIGIARLDVRHRNGSSEYSGDRNKIVGSFYLSRLAFFETSYDVGARFTRRAYDDTGVVSPSDFQSEVEGRVSIPAGDDWRVILDGRYDAVVVDDPDDVYFDTLEGELDARVARDLGAFTVEAGPVGEWLRPQGSAGRAYDQGEILTKGAYFAGSDLWFDVEERVGFRNYHGERDTDPTSLSFATSDFRYSELSLLLGARWGALTSDVFGQYTVEWHDQDADDVSYFLLTFRLGARY